MNIANKKFISFLKSLFAIFVVLTLLFGRSFMGLYLFSYRIGELLILLAFLLTLYFIFNRKKFVAEYDPSFYNLLILITVTFLIFIFINEDSLLNPYVYKSSLYIWTTSFIFVGKTIFENLKINTNHIRILYTLLFVIYIISVLYYPDIFKSFFETYSDKFQFLKASEIVLAYLLIMIINNYFLDSKNNIYYFLLVSALFLPLFLVMSRGSALACIVFIIFEIFIHFNKLTKTKSKTALVFFLCAFIFLGSSYSIVEDEQIEKEGQIAVVENILSVKNTNPDRIRFFISENRLYSSDGNINWRLQIWQDVFEDSKSNFYFLKGENYSEKINAMNNPSYQGMDGTNENVHNYFINIYARGGIVHLALLLLLYRKILVTNSNLKILEKLSCISPFLIVSMFDSSMESPSFPFIFFLVIGMLLSNIEFVANKRN